MDVLNFLFHNNLIECDISCNSLKNINWGNITVLCSPLSEPGPSVREVGELVNDGVFPCPVWGCITLFGVAVSGPTTYQVNEMESVTTTV